MGSVLIAYPIDMPDDARVPFANEFARRNCKRKGRLSHVVRFFTAPSARRPVAAARHGRSAKVFAQTVDAGGRYDSETLLLAVGVFPRPAGRLLGRGRSISSSFFPGGSGEGQSGGQQYGIRRCPIRRDSGTLPPQAGNDLNGQPD